MCNAPGCLDVNNMTMVPEAMLAKEAVSCYARIVMATNYDCWVEHENSINGWDF